MSNTSAEAYFNQKFKPDYETDYIIRYNGDLSDIQNETDIKITILSPTFAIANGDINLLLKYPKIEYIDTPKQLYFSDEKALRSACITETARNGLSGRGVLVGIIDSGISNIATEFGDRIIGVYDTVTDTIYTYEDILSGVFKGNDSKNHGTPVASITAGISGVAYGAWIAAVKIDDTNGYTSSVQIMKGLKYISDLTKEMNVPSAINISYGTNDGSHSGKSLFEQYINEISVTKNITVVVSVGNEGNKAKHYSGTFNQDIEIKIDSGVKSISFSIWKNPIDTISFELISPNGISTGVLDYREKQFERKSSSTLIRGVFGDVSPYYAENEIYIRLDGIDGFIDAGIWKIKPVNSNYTDVNLWLPVNSSAEFLKPYIGTTITIPSSASSVISVSAYNPENNSPTAFSGRGYTAVGAVKPDISAPGVNITAVSANGTKDNFTGTSFAAPIVTGCVALLLEWGLVQGNDKLLFGEKLKSALIQGAVRDENSVYPNRINGYGRLCFKNTINILKGVQTFAVKPTSTDENYADVAFDYSGALENIFKDNNVEFCKICSAYLLAFIPKKVYDSIISDESFGSGVRAGIPLLLAPMAVDENTENALDESGITDVHNILGLRGSGILIGIIDDGIDMLNEEFIFDDGTSKIIFIWNQTEADNDNCYGKVYTAEEINSALKNGVQLAPSTDGHGTKLAVVSAGKNGSAPDCEIIVVKLKQAKQYLKDRLFIGNKTAYQNTDVMTALDFITQKAYELVKPVSILIGLGTNEGGHNGYSIFEKCLSTVAVKNGICITVPTGNEATSGHHCSFDLNGKNSYYDIELNVNKNSNGTVIWLWNSLLSRISISVISPVDETIERIQPSTSFIRSYKLNLTNSTVEINYNLPLYKTSEQLTQIRISNLTQGVWKIRVFADTDNSVQILGWLPVSPFTDDGVYFLSPDTKTTLTVPSTATDIIAVGGWNSNDGSNYTKSGRGPTANGLLRPDITAPVLNGGTSFSAAFVAGSAALLLEWGIVRKNNINMNTTTISAYIANGAKKQNGSIYPNNIEGYGRLDLYNTFKNL